MKPRAMVAFNVAGTLVFVSVFFWFGRDHSLLALGRWVALFGAALLIPMYWSGKVEAEIAKLPQPVAPELRRAPLYPILAGIMTLVAALGLLPGGH